MDTCHFSCHLGLLCKQIVQDVAKLPDTYVLVIFLQYTKYWEGRVICTKIPKTGTQCLEITSHPQYLLYWGKITRKGGEGKTDKNRLALVDLFLSVFRTAVSGFFGFSFPTLRKGCRSILSDPVYKKFIILNF